MYQGSWNPSVVKYGKNNVWLNILTKNPDYRREDLIFEVLSSVTRTELERT